MRPTTIRVMLIGLIVVAAIVSVVAKKLDSPFLGWVSFAFFLGGVAAFAKWRRAVAEEQRGRVFDREAKTDETRTRPDQ